MTRMASATWPRLTVVALATVATAAACGGGSSGGSSSTTSGGAAPAAVATRTASGSTYLTDAAGRTLYAFSIDGNGTSMCSGDCAKEWIPFTATTTPAARGGAVASRLGVAAHHQVTYAGHPLYYFEADTAAGDRNGQGLDDFGGVWSTVTTAGSPTTAKGHSDDSSDSGSSNDSGSGNGGSSGGSGYSYP